MKFSLHTAAGSRLRSGTLTGFKRFPDKVFDTPLILLYTKSGSVPHLTHEVLQLVTKETHVVQQTLPSTYLMHETVKMFKKGISNFVGLQECLTYFSVQDPAHKTPEGYNHTREVSVWSQKGRKTLTSDVYMDIVEAFQPDLYQALSNGDTNPLSTKKKILKVLDSSRILYEDCLKRHNASDTLRDKSLLAVLEGGHDVEARKQCALSYRDAPVDGFVINGLHNNGPEVETADFAQIQSAVDATISHLPCDKPRILHGCWSPQNLLKLTEMGIDIFDASYPYVMTEKMNALTFAYESVDVEQEDKEGFEPALELSLTDEKYREDFAPISHDCACLTCEKHTRAYVHHLIKNKELLAWTLIMIHNLHHYLTFFQAIRQSIAEGRKLRLK